MASRERSPDACVCLPYMSPCCLLMSAFYVAGGGSTVASRERSPVSAGLQRRFAASYFKDKPDDSRTMSSPPSSLVASRAAVARTEAASSPPAAPPSSECTESHSRPVTRAPVGIRADDDVFVWTPGAAGVGGAVVGAEGGAECMPIDAYDAGSTGEDT